MPDRNQIGSCRQIAVPDVVVHCLKVPDSGACGRVNRQNTIGEQVRSLPVATPEIERCRTSGQEHQTTLLIDSDATPGIGATRPLPSVWRPSIVSVLVWMRDGMENPPDFACANVIRPYVARRRRPWAFRDCRAQNQKVAINRTGGSRVYEEILGLSSQPVPQV